MCVREEQNKIENANTIVLVLLWKVVVLITINICQVPLLLLPPIVCFVSLLKYICNHMTYISIFIFVLCYSLWHAKWQWQYTALYSDQRSICMFRSEMLFIQHICSDWGGVWNVFRCHIFIPPLICWQCPTHKYPSQLKSISELRSLSQIHTTMWCSTAFVCRCVGFNWKPFQLVFH